MEYSNHCVIYEIRYFNVIFCLLAATEMDDYKINLLGEKIESGYPMKMGDIHKWCLSQNIYYKTIFRYRRDCPISANMWNFYSYCRFMFEKHWNTIKKEPPFFI